MIRLFLHKTLQFIPILVASKNRPVHRYCLTGCREKNKIQNPFLAEKALPQDVLWKLSFSLKVLKNPQIKSLFWIPLLQIYTLHHQSKVYACSQTWLRAFVKTDSIKDVLLKHSILLLFPRKLFVLQSHYSKISNFFNKVAADFS